MTVRVGWPGSENRQCVCVLTMGSEYRRRDLPWAKEEKAGRSRKGREGATNPQQARQTNATNLTAMLCMFSFRRVWAKPAVLHAVEGGAACLVQIYKPSETHVATRSIAHGLVSGIQHEHPAERRELTIPAV